MKNKRIGETNISSKGQKMTIIAYRNYDDLDVIFEDNTVVRNTSYSQFNKGTVKNPNFLLKKYTRKVRKANNGQKMTIIAYRNSKDIDVMFEDGTVVKNVSYNLFKKGSIKNPNFINKLHIGEVYTTNEGYKVTVIDFLSSYNATIQFEDGTIRDNVIFSNLKKGNVSKEKKTFKTYNPYKTIRVGERARNNQGMQMRIIKYNSSKDITIQFEDGTILEKRDYQQFKKGKIFNPNCNVPSKITKTNKILKNNGDKSNYYIGMTNLMENGLCATIITYKNSHDITVKFNDDNKTIIKHKTYDSFKKGKISNKPKPDYQMRVGETGLMKCGLKATIIVYRMFNDIDIKFENGIVREHMNYNDFKKGNIAMKPRNCFVGETNKMSCNINATIINVKKYKDIDIQLENGVILRHITYYSFKMENIDVSFDEINAGLQNKAIERIGLTKTMNCGMDATIIAYLGNKNIYVRFKDGTVVKNRYFYDFKNGTIKNPNLKKTK